MYTVPCIQTYTDAAIFEDELDRTWHRGWVYVGHESEIREPGDYCLKRIGLQEMIMTRDEMGKVAASEKGNANCFRHPYHGWTFKNDGALAGAPYQSGYKVLVANPRKTRLIYGDKRKTDKLDAQKLARLARVDPELLYSVEHRSEDFQTHLALIHSRDALIRSRTQLINHIRGTVKSFGQRPPGCSADSFHKEVSDQLPDELSGALEDIVETIGSLTEKIKDYDRRIERVCKEIYPQETGLLQQIPGVGALTSLTYVLTPEAPDRFKKSRAVGAYLGLVPGKDQSGDSDPGKWISGKGDEMLRRLLVNGARYILGPFAPDSDLRRHGEKIASRGGKNTKKRAVVAVAGKLAALLHRLWMNGEVYDSPHNARLSGILGEEVA